MTLRSGIGCIIMISGERTSKILGRRIRWFRDFYGMSWDRRQTMELVERCTNIIQEGEGIDDVDLRAMVRLFNREIAGRKTRERIE